MGDLINPQVLRFQISVLQWLELCIYHYQFKFCHGLGRRQGGVALRSETQEQKPSKCVFDGQSLDWYGGKITSKLVWGPFSIFPSSHSWSQTWGSLKFRVRSMKRKALHIKLCRHLNIENKVGDDGTNNHHNVMIIVVICCSCRIVSFVLPRTIRQRFYVNPTECKSKKNIVVDFS